MEADESFYVSLKGPDRWSGLLEESVASDGVTLLACVNAAPAQDMNMYSLTSALWAARASGYNQ